ncbi:PLP-dependent aminotransferase family protein [Paenibacillus sp. OV219]|uniref:MocR-like pyridoxine biosynthesis transcription factor PdxR n=1 Tax=Paenibacillus sp. OV219 TaxID=1884377 RepID=UPI000B8672F9|nr:PLP-dependent aminotransferase family protein [Paenibacillus sp. OV219]
MISLTPKLEKESESPLYDQLYRYIRKQIEDGALAVNDRLPSIRQLSAHLLVSKNTIEAAYQQLLSEGYLQSRPRSGIFVLPLEQLPVASVRQMKEQPSQEISEQGRAGTIDFEYGDVELELFPVKVWKKCLAEAMDDRLHEVVGYGDRQGHLGLREEIARYLFQSRGVSCSADQIFLSAGTAQAISLLCQLLPLTERIAMEEPGYNGARAVFVNHLREIVPIPLEEDGLSIEALRGSGANVVYVTPSHQFPIGIVMPVQKRGKLLQWAYEQGGFILEDDYDSEFRYQGQPIPALKALDRSDRVIYLGTFSKSFLPGARLSYVVLPESLADTYREGLQNYSQSVSTLIQTAMYLFMRDGGFERHVRKMRKLYQTRHRTLLRAIHDQLESRVGVIGQKSGMHLLLNVIGRDCEELIQLAAQRGVQVYSPMKHWTNPADCPRSYIMLGFAGLQEEQIREGVSRLRQAWFE